MIKLAFELLDILLAKDYVLTGVSCQGIHKHSLYFLCVVYVINTSTVCGQATYLSLKGYWEK